MPRCRVSCLNAILRERERVQTELSLHNMHEQQNALGAREDLTVQ